MILFPNAKINLGLNVVAKRTDGYHNIISVFYPIPLRDMLEIVVAPELPEGTIEFSFSGIPVPGTPQQNLIYKAHSLIAKDYSIPAIRVHLHKSIPMGGGLGGGSSNASFFIKALNTVTELNLSWGEMHHYAKQCGSDCSFFLINKPCLVTQTGNEIEPLNFSLSGYWLQLVLPGIHCSTPAAYAAIQPKEPHFNPEDIRHTEINKWKDLLMNDFETNAFQQFPLLQKIKEQFYHQGALYAAMSGSGSAMFAIYSHEPKQSTIFEGCQSITFLLT